MIVPALSDFLERYSEIRLEVGWTDPQVDLLQEGVDFLLSRDRPPSRLLSLLYLSFSRFSQRTSNGPEPL